MEANLSSPLNGSELVICDSAVSRAPWILLVVVVSIICVLGVLGNGLVIWVAGFRMAHTVTTICYLNLALADFSFTATLPFLVVSMAMKEKWPFGWLLCKLVHIVVDINLCGSVFLITLIALDRCVCVLYPVWAQNHRTVSLARKLVVGIWILALTPILPHSLFLTRVEDSRGEVLCTFSFESWSDTPEEWLKMNISRLAAFRILSFVIGFILPMSIITICYALIAAKIRRRGLVHSGRPLRVLTSVVASFFICWFPFQLVSLLGTFWLKKNLLRGSYKILDMLLNLTSALAFFNSCLNPILYVFMGQNFRERLIQSLPASLERALREDLSQTWNKGANSTPPFANTEL